MPLTPDPATTATTATTATAEQTMRDAKVPTLASADELTAYIADLVDRPHDYGTCVYAMSMAAVAAYNHVASKLDVTGFQASCADLDIMRRTRDLESGIVLNFENALYPQYDLHEKLDEALVNARPWLKEQAVKMLAEKEDYASPAVVAHWHKLATAPADAVLA